MAMKSFNDYGPTYYQPSERVVTPHIRWAKPLEGGPLKVLFVTNHKSTRDIVELAQRLEMDYEVFTTEMRDVFAHPDLPVDYSRPEDYEARLQEKLAAEQQYDLIVVANIKWDILPRWSREEIMARIEKGTGLVGLVRAGYDESWLKLHARPEPVPAAKVFSPFPYLALPEYQGGQFKDYKEGPAFMCQVVDTYKYGQGRIVQIKGVEPPIRQMITPAYATDMLNVKMLHYDYHLSLPIRLMLWAGRKTPSVRVRAVQPWQWCHTDEASMNREDLEPIAFRLEADEARRVQLSLVVRNHDNEILGRQERTVDVNEGDNLVRFDPLAMPAGTHFADLWAKSADSDKILDFGTLSLEVHSQVYLRDLILDNDNFQKEQAVTGHALVANSTGDELLVVRQIDNFGRLTGVSTVEIPASVGGESSMVPFSVKANDTRSVRQELRTQLMRNNQVLDARTNAVTISDFYAPNDIRYAMFISENGHCYVDILYMRELARAGYGSVWANPDTKRASPPAAWANLYRMTSDYGPSSADAVQTDLGPVRSTFLTDPDVIQTMERKATILGQRLGKFSNRDFSLASEGGFIRGHGDKFNACFSPTCLAHFHRWLKEQYGRLETLNAEYQTNYRSWEQVIPISLTEARNRPNLLPLWVDHRRHMETVWTSFFENNARAFRKATPTAHVGYQCSGSIGHGGDSYGAVDYWAMNQAMTLNCNYPGPFAPEAARDFIQPGAVLGNDHWGGYEFGRHELFTKWAPWRSMLRGANMFSVFRGLGYPVSNGENTGSEMTCLAPDLSWYPHMYPGNAEVREIKRGIGKLLMESRRSHDGIAVMYSNSSTHVSAFTDTLPDYESTLRAFPYLLEDAGYQYRTVSYEQVAQGMLNEGEFKVLYLPYCQAVSRQQAKAIESFAAAGGIVIADLRPGVANEHGKPYAVGVLDELFGVRQRTDQAQGIRGLVTVSHPLGSFQGRTILSKSDASLEVTTGKVHGRSEQLAILRKGRATRSFPAVIVNSYGKGTGILLNFSTHEYGVEAGTSRRLRELLRAVLQSVNVLPAVTLSPKTPGSTAHRYQQGRSVYVGLLRNPPGKNVPGHDHGQQDIDRFRPERFTIALPGEFHLYDMRAGEYLGLKDRVEQVQGGVTAFMLAALPYRVGKIDLHAAKTQCQPGDVVQVRAQLRAEDGHPTGLHVLHIELIDPERNKARWLSSNKIARQGESNFVVPFALNAQSGVWRLVVRDAATGVSEEIELELDVR